MELEKKFEILSQINRASHFEWRRAALSMIPDADPKELIRRYWAEVGKDTARFYLSRMDKSGDIAKQMAELFVASSDSMGETASVDGQSEKGGWMAHHEACPWFDWHRREGLLDEDQFGCDCWLQTVIDEINAAIPDAGLKFETTESLPAGASRCTRRFWQGT